MLLRSSAEDFLPELARIESLLFLNCVYCLLTRMQTLEVVCKVSFKNEVL